jgi:hypothetical protein
MNIQIALLRYRCTEIQSINNYTNHTDRLPHCLSFSHLLLYDHVHSLTHGPGSMHSSAERSLTERCVPVQVSDAPLLFRVRADGLALTCTVVVWYGGVMMVVIVMAMVMVLV